MTVFVKRNARSMTPEKLFSIPWSCGIVPGCGPTVPAREFGGTARPAECEKSLDYMAISVYLYV